MHVETVVIDKDGEYKLIAKLNQEEVKSVMHAGLNTLLKVGAFPFKKGGDSTIIRDEFPEQ